MPPKAEKDPKAKPKKDEKAPAKKDDKPVRKERGPKVWKDHKDKSHRRKGPNGKGRGYTVFQIARRQKRLRRPKAWDLKHRKKTRKGPRYHDIFAAYPEVLELIKDLEAKGKKFTKNTLKIRKPKVVKKKKRVTKWKRLLLALLKRNPAAKRIHTKEERQTKNKWSFKQYRLLFGVYSDEENLVKYFKDNSDPAAFVKRNRKHNMKYASIISKGRQKLRQTVTRRARLAPECVAKTTKTLVELKADADYATYMKKMVGAELDKICPLLQSYVVCLVRSGFEPNEELKKNVIKFASA